MARSSAKRAAVRRPHRWSRFRVGFVAIVVLAPLIYLAFAKDIPFTKGYRITAVFESANNLRPGSPVRIAGVNVGEVKSVGRYRDTNLSQVEMEIRDEGLPIREDATFKIRPRIFLEGNFFVDVKPGTAGARPVPDGGTIGVAQTSTPVQLDQLLSALTSDTREELQHLLKEYGAALNARPTPAQDAELPPETQGLTGAQALARAAGPGGHALRDATIINDALRGERRGDLTRTFRNIAGLSRTLERRERQLQDLIVDFNLTAAAFANQSGALSQSVRLLGPTLVTARAALRAVDDALPSVRAFSREIVPGLRETPATVQAAFPWIAQTRRLLGPDQLQGLMAELTPTTRDLAALTNRSIRLLPEIGDFARCFDRVILPTGDIGLEDGHLTTRRADGSIVESYKEFWYGLVGMAGTGQTFDGNGPLLRAAAGGGEWEVVGGRGTYVIGDKTLVGTATERPLGTRPLYPSSPPPIRTDVPCWRNDLPDLNGPQAGPGPAPQSVAVPTPPPFPRRELPTAAPTTGSAPTGSAARADGERADGDGAVREGASVGAALLSRLNALGGVR